MRVRYFKTEQKFIRLIFIEVFLAENRELNVDLQRYLKHDQEVLENQLNTLKYKRILSDSIETLKKSNLLITQASQSKADLNQFFIFN